MRKNNITISHIPEGEGTGVMPYAAPAIEVIRQVYDEGLMQKLSLGITTTPATGGGDAKPGGEWSDMWSGPVSNASTTDDSWDMDK